MVVTATRIEQPLTDVLADVSIVGRDVIEQSGANSLSDVLARLPGIQMQRNGGPASTTSVYLRGAETRFTAVFVDGIRMDSQSTGGASWNAIPLSQVERIEVLRGPAAAIYGSDALGGVVQIFTRKGEPGLSRSAELGVGTHGTSKLDLGLAGSEGVWDYALGLDRELSKGYNVKPAGNPDKDGYQNTALSARLGLQVTPDHKLDATFLRNRVDGQYDSSNTLDDHSYLDTQAIGLNWSARWSDLYKTKVSVSRGSDHYATAPSVYETDTDVTSYLWQNIWTVGGQTFTAALERREDELRNGSTTPVNTSRSQNALALGYGLRIGAHTLQLNVRGDDDSEFGNHTTGSAAYGYALTPNWSATVSAGTAFRAPTLFHRFSIYGDASLKPEKSRSVEVGLKYVDKSSHFSALAYRNRVSDLISYVSGPGSCINGADPFYPGCYGNTGRAQLNGLSFSGGTHWAGVELGASLDFLSPKDQSTGKRLPRRAKQTAMLTADTVWLGSRWGAEWQLVGERFDDVANTRRLGGFALLNLHVETPLVKDWSVVARVDNLGNKYYQTSRGYNTPGRVFYVGLRWSDR